MVRARGFNEAGIREGRSGSAKRNEVRSAFGAEWLTHSKRIPRGGLGGIPAGMFAMPRAASHGRPAGWRAVAMLAG
jgi:hypothetical protein